MDQAHVEPGTEPRSTLAAATRREATLRMGPLMQLPRVLAELGFDPVAVLDGTGIEAAFFADADMPLPYGAALRLLAHCGQHTGCEHLGLLLGERSGAEALGLTGMLLLAAPDVGTGLAHLAQYLDLHDRGAAVVFETSGHDCWLGYDILVDEDAGVSIAQDLALAIARNLMRACCGEIWAPREVLLPRPAPADPGPWARYFLAPVRFGAARCALRFPRDWLQRRLAASNPTLHAYLRKEAERLQSLLGRDAVDDVRRVVQGLVAYGPVSAARVASLLGMHERTLHRRLRTHDTSFRRVRDEVLLHIARCLLGTTSMRVAEVAAALGYSEASAFIHAFGRWSGQTPEEWRRAARSRRAGRAG